MPIKHLIIDGNNLIHACGERLIGRRPGDFEAARWALARKLDGMVGGLADRVTVVFDGTKGGRDQAFRSKGMKVIYSPAHLTADSIIERMVYDAARPENLMVVTSDRGERMAVDSAGGQTMSCQSFVEWVEDQRRTMDLRLNRSKQDSPGVTLGDFFPDGK